jgi:hypothetical protein
MAEPNQVPWWVSVGHHPTAAEAEGRFEAVRSQDPDPAAFTFRQFYPWKYSQCKRSRRCAQQATRITTRAQRATQIDQVCTHHKSLYCPPAADQIGGYVLGCGVLGSHSPLPSRPTTGRTTPLLPGSFDGHREAC